MRSVHSASNFANVNNNGNANNNTATNSNGIRPRLCYRERKALLIRRKERKSYLERVNANRGLVTTSTPTLGKKMIEKAWELDNLYKAWLKVRQVSHWKEQTERYEENLMFNLTELQERLFTKSITLGKSRKFIINERGKSRLIHSYDLDTRIAVRSFIDNILLPLVAPKLIYDNGASMTGKGLDFYRNRIIAHLQKYYRKYGNKGYILTIDFQKYFDNIDHVRLKAMFSELLQDEECEEFVNTLIDLYRIDISCLSDEERAALAHSPFDSVKFYLEHGESVSGSPVFLERGVSIGGQLSQIAGIFYPYPLDNYIKIVKGEKFYAHYMDDLYVVHQSKEHLSELLENIKVKCDEYGIFLNEKKTQITPINRPFTICKIQYLVKEDGDILRKPCKDTFVRERKALRKFKDNIEKGLMTEDEAHNAYLSWRGNMSRFDCEKSIESMDRYYRERIGEVA